MPDDVSPSPVTVFRLSVTVTVEADPTALAKHQDTARVAAANPHRCGSDESEVADAVVAKIKEAMPSIIEVVKAGMSA